MASVWVVLALVFAASLFSLLTAFPRLRRRSHRSRVRAVSGWPAMIGEAATVVDEVAGFDPRGHVRVWGENWPAVTGDGTRVPRATLVLVVAIDKSTLVIERTVPTGGVAVPPAPI